MAPAPEKEARLDALREEARLTGRVAGEGGPVAGGPIPPAAAPPGYYGRPIVKPPVWTWEVPLYFFVGGTAGMAAVLAAVALAIGRGAPLARPALRIAAAGAALAPLLLTADLGRPARFLNMLRVFKWRSPMSVGAWTLVFFGGFAVPAALLADLVPRALVLALAAGAGLFGALLATYTGVLLAATAIPAWASHRRLLPFHFGVAALGSAAALLEILGYRLPALHAIGLAAAAIETGVAAWLELAGEGRVDRPLRAGASGLLLRAAGILAGPLALGLRLAGAVPAAAASFLLGALAGRYGWLAAGRASARDPLATFAAQAGGG